MHVIKIEQMYNASHWKGIRPPYGKVWAFMSNTALQWYSHNNFFFFLNLVAIQFRNQTRHWLINLKPQNQSVLRTEKGQQTKDIGPFQQKSNDLKFFLE